MFHLYIYITISSFRYLKKKFEKPNGYQESSIEKEDTLQWPHQKGNRTNNYLHKTLCKIIKIEQHIATKTVGELTFSGRAMHYLILEDDNMEKQMQKLVQHTC